MELARNQELGYAWLRDAVPYPGGRYHDAGAVKQGGGGFGLVSGLSIATYCGDSPA